MLQPQVTERLHRALIATAGGYLRNPVRQNGVTCPVCATPAGGYKVCYPCNQHRVHPGLADRVAALTYAVARSQSGYVMRGYKARPRIDEHYKVVAMLVLLAMAKHGACPGVLAGYPNHALGIGAFTTRQAG
jgi:hypothetical protein